MRGLLGRVSLFFYALFPRHARTKNRKWHADTHYDTHPNPKKKTSPLCGCRPRFASTAQLCIEALFEDFSISIPGLEEVPSSGSHRSKRSEACGIVCGCRGCVLKEAEIIPCPLFIVNLFSYLCPAALKQKQERYERYCISFCAVVLHLLLHLD